MIIIEGCDNTGKTTLQKEILERYPGLREGYKQERPPEDKQPYMDRLWGFLGQPVSYTRPFVFDRLYFSELVYGPILRGNVIFTKSESVIINKMIKRHRALIIYARRSLYEIMKDFDSRDQLNGVKENLPLIHYAYDEVMEPYSNSCNFVMYDYDNPISVSQAWNKVKEYYEDKYAY